MRKAACSIRGVDISTILETMKRVRAKLSSQWPGGRNQLSVPWGVGEGGRWLVSKYAVSIFSETNQGRTGVACIHQPIFNPLCIIALRKFHPRGESIVSKLVAPPVQRTRNSKISKAKNSYRIATNVMNKRAIF